MRLRNISKKRWFWSGIGYRGCAILITSLSLKLFLPRITNILLLAIYINSINMIVYYIYHYWFLRLFKMGEEDGK